MLEPRFRVRKLRHQTLQVCAPITQLVSTANMRWITLGPVGANFSRGNLESSAPSGSRPVRLPRVVERMIPDFGLPTANPMVCNSVIHESLVDIWLVKDTVALAGQLLELGTTFPTSFWRHVEAHRDLLQRQNDSLQERIDEAYADDYRLEVMILGLRYVLDCRYREAEQREIEENGMKGKPKEKDAEDQSAAVWCSAGVLFM